MLPINAAADFLLFSGGAPFSARAARRIHTGNGAHPTPYGALQRGTTPCESAHTPHDEVGEE